MMQKQYYQRQDPSLHQQYMRAGRLLHAFNQALYEDQKEKENILRELLGSAGNNLVIEHNFHCDIGSNIHVGHNFYAGWNCSMIDLAEIRIGHNCMIAPDCGLYTAGHNIQPENRHLSGYAQPIHIGDNVWIGGQSVILGGVTIGDNSIVAAASLVLKDVPANCIVGGNPAKKLRDILPEGV